MTSTLPVPGAVELTPAWFTATLQEHGVDATVEHVATEPVGTGQLAETLRFTLDYAGTPAPGAPRSLVGKFTSDNPTAAATGRELGIYRSEVMFYRDLAGRAGLRTPAVWAAEIDDDGRFALVLEDLAPARPGNQLERCTPDDVRLALREAAMLHAAFWAEDTLTGLDWLSVPETAQGLYTTELIEQSWSHVREIYAGRLPDDVADVCRLYVGGHAAWNAPRPGPRCLSHNDFRPDNMLFGHPDGRIALVDWQTVSYLGVGMDVPYLLSGALDRDVRATLEPELLHGYHDELTARGVTGYSFDRLMADYRHYTFAALAVALAATLLVKRTERGDQMLIRMIVDASRHALDAGALDLLER